MKEYDFTLILAHDPSEAEAERLYGRIDDATLATIAGVPQMHFHREAASLESAIGSALNDLRSAGLDAVRVEIEPQTVLRS